MYGILIDSSNTNLSLGISKDHVVVQQVSYEAWQQQSELLVAELDKLMKKAKITRQDISYVVVSKGPGSYTGVRIALSVAKVMAFALKVPLYLASSLEMMKSDKGATICLVNARSKRSYIGVYEGEKEILKDQIMDNVDVLKYMKEHPSYLVSGDLAYLSLDGLKINVIDNLNHGDVERNLSKEPLAAKPVYLKDNYPV